MFVSRRRYVLEPLHLGLVLWAAARKHLGREEAAAALDRLTHSSLWISVRVLAEARAALDRLFA